MSLFSRIGAFFRGDFSEAFGPAHDAPFDFDRGERGEGEGFWQDERVTDLPAGWQFEALYHKDTGMTKNADPTDSEIAGADAIIVSFTDELGKDYRTIHRANTRASVGQIIETVTVPDSPVR